MLILIVGVSAVVAAVVVVALVLAVKAVRSGAVVRHTRQDGWTENGYADPTAGTGFPD